ncbi:MAG: serine/threonine-protein kinase [Proteobacteria bacterium]|nr:serine/threonine-protein kinase [Pseudomonadota bacterium]
MPPTMPAAADDSSDWVLDLGSPRSELQPGDRLGNWTLRRELGSGGMGRVFLAERSDGHYEQQVAVKLLLSWDDAGGLEQLARERRILAGLTHPNIARLIDGGSTPLGQPYLVMEYVQGVPLHQHCIAGQLALPQVLALFRQVLDAVAAAHRQLVVHCDLKPGNVLVTPEGRAMLLDFGIARLQGSTTADTLHDAASFTPRYASPEQRRGDKPSVPSDVYSLGVMLGDLLQPLKLPPRRAREIQAIVARATAADPERRYAGVGALAADLQRFTEHRPVAALPATPAYLTIKLLRRRWAWSTAAALALLAGVAFTVSLVQQRDRAQAAERLALQEAAATRAVSDFVVGLFEGADPAVSGRKDMPASELVARGRERIELDMQQQPALQAGFKTVLGKVFENIGRPADAVALYTQSAALDAAAEARTQPGRAQRRALTLSRLAVVLSNEGQAAQAEAPAREALALLAAQGDAEGGEAALAEAHNTLGIVLGSLQRHDEALAHLQQALALRQRLFGDEHELVAVVLHNIGLTQRAAGQPQQAEQTLRRSLAIKQARWPAGHPLTLGTLEVLGRVLNEQRRFDEAEALLLQALRARAALYGDDNEKTAVVHNELANVLHDRGRVADALPHYREALRITEQGAGQHSINHAVRLNNLATALEDLGQVGEAAAGYRRSLETRQALLPPGDLAIARAQHNLGRYLLRAGQPAAARPLIEAAAATRAARLAPDHRDRLETRFAQAELALAAGDAAAARAALDELQPRLQALGPARQLQHARLQAQWLASQGRVAEALQQAAEAERQGRASLPPAQPELQRLQLLGAQLALAGGDAAQARARLQALQPLLAAQEPAAPLRQQAEALQRRLATAPIVPTRP